MKTKALTRLGARAVFAAALAGMAVFAARGELPAEFCGAPEEILKAAKDVTPEKYPDADVVMLLDSFYTKYEPDGTYVEYNDEWIKALTEKGRRSCAAVGIRYNERYGTGELLETEIYGADGTVRKIDFKKLQKTASDNSSMSMNIIDPMDRRVSCPVPGMAVGEIRHVRTRRTVTKARMKDTWAGMHLLETTSPICEIRVGVDQPAELPLAHAALCNPFGDTCKRLPDRDLGNGRKLLSWRVENVPQVFPEPNMPSLTRCAQTLMLSTIKTWEDVSSWYWRISLPHLEKTTPEMTNEVARLVKDCKTREERIAAVFKFVSQQIRYMGLTLEDDAPGYEPHDVDVTFNNRYGVCRDKAALLAAMLRIAGEKAFPVLIHAEAKMDEEVATPYFNHAIAAVENPPGSAEKYMLMDPTDETTRDLLPAYLNDKSYLVARPEGEGLRTSPVPDVERNMLEVDSHGKINDDGSMVLTSEFKFKGINDTALRGMLLKQTPAQRQRWAETLAAGMSSEAELLSVEIFPEDLQNTREPLAARLVVRLRECALKGDTRIEFAAPLYTRVLSVVRSVLASNTILEKRRFPLSLQVTAGTRERLRVDFSEWAGGVLKLPDTVNVTNAPGYGFRLEYKVKGDELVVEREMKVSDVNFSVPAYHALREAGKEVESAERCKVLFAPNTEKDLNFRYITNDTAMHFTSPYSWVSTNVVEKQILTYAGKKSSAELKYSYNPAVGGLEVVGASVSNRNGKVHYVTDKEVNILDCGWAGAAPRYAAGKMLVVNLPAVEEGSVIRYSVVRTVTNSPVAWTGSMNFRSGAEVDFHRFEVHYPKSANFRRETLGGEFTRVKELHRGLEKGFYEVEGDGMMAWAAIRPDRTPGEPSQPNACEWTPTVEMSMADWEDYRKSLGGALERARKSGSEKALKLARETFGALESSEAKIEAVRKFMEKRIRIAGPGLFELPFGIAFSAPDRALEEGYASGADWMNLAFVLLEGAGFDCTMVLADNVTWGEDRTVARVHRMGTVNWYDSLVVRARESAPWYAPWRSCRDFWVGHENEYVPGGATSHSNERYLDLSNGRFGRIGGAPDTSAALAAGTLAGLAGYPDGRESLIKIALRPNGAADMDLESRTYGVAVGAERKFHAEMLPELRQRHMQALMGAISKAATATSELRTDVQGYPMVMSYSAYVPDYAVVSDGAITLKLPGLAQPIFGVGNKNHRETPIRIGGANFTREEYVAVFPEGYDQIELLPESYEFTDPSGRIGAGVPWVVRQTVGTDRDEAGRMRVKVVRVTARDLPLNFAADYFGVFKEWNRRSSSDRSCTIIMRKR